MAALCSICLEEVQTNVGRAVATLACSHIFHLDCIGYEFHTKDQMRCPNCRAVEQSQWQAQQRQQEQQEARQLRLRQLQQEEEDEEAEEQQRWEQRRGLITLLQEQEEEQEQRILVRRRQRRHQRRELLQQQQQNESEEEEEEAEEEAEQEQEPVERGPIGEHYHVVLPNGDYWCLLGEPGRQPHRVRPPSPPQRSRSRQTPYERPASATSSNSRRLRGSTSSQPQRNVTDPGSRLVSPMPNLEELFNRGAFFRSQPPGACP